MRTRERSEPNARRRTSQGRVHAFSEVAHMLEEVEQRRSEMRSLRQAEEGAAVRLAAAGRAVEEAAADEDDAAGAGVTSPLAYPALADPAALPRTRAALQQAVADTMTRIPETRGRLEQLRRAAALRGRLARCRERNLWHGARQMDVVDRKVKEAQRLLNQARDALQAAGLEDVETRITPVAAPLKTAEERARADRRRQRDRAASARGGQAGARAAGARRRRNREQMDERNNGLRRLLHAVADSLDLPRTRWMTRCAMPVR